MNMRSAFWIVFNLDHCPVAIDMTETGDCVGNPNPMPLGKMLGAADTLKLFEQFARKSGTIICDINAEICAVQIRKGNGQSDDVVLLMDPPVFHRIFNEGLQNQRRNPCLEKVNGNFLHKAEAVAETDFLDLNIGMDQAQFIVEPD